MESYRKSLTQYISGVLWYLLYWNDQTVIPRVFYIVADNIGKAEIELISIGLTDNQLLLVQDFCRDLIVKKKYLNSPIGYGKIVRMIFQTPTQSLISS